MAHLYTMAIALHCTNCASTDWHELCYHSAILSYRVQVLCHAQNKIDHLRDVFCSQSLGLVLKNRIKSNIYQQQKATVTEIKHKKLKPDSVYNLRPRNGAWSMLTAEDTTRGNYRAIWNLLPTQMDKWTHNLVTCAKIYHHGSLLDYNFTPQQS